MKFEDAAKALDPDIYHRFKDAIELGKWPDGRVLTKDQKELCLQAIMLYEAKHKIAETDRVGYIDTAKKTSPCGSDKSDPDDTSEIKILH